MPGKNFKPSIQLGIQEKEALNNLEPMSRNTAVRGMGLENEMTFVVVTV